jgi:hypothetical protein
MQTKQANMIAPACIGLAFLTLSLSSIASCHLLKFENSMMSQAVGPPFKA